MTSKNFTGVKDVGLSMAIWDGAVDVRDQQPIWNGLPSINTVTFMYSEHVPITGNTQTRYTMQKQNLRIMNEGFANKAVVGRVVISPDTFYVTKYYDRPTYTWADLAGAVGGMASIALAVWIFLFGGGKYKSWGIMQRYVLRTSPDSKNDSEPETPSKGVYDRAVGFFRKQLARLDSSADSDLEHMPRQSMSQDRRRSSARYSIVLNMNPAAAAAMATGSSKGARSSVASQGGNGYDHRYPMESPVQSSFYFSDQGTPGSQSLCPLAPIGEGEDDAEEQVSELIRLIDLRVDEKMWSLERTLARYYLDGFRLRNYSHQYIGDQSYLGKDIETAIDPSNQDTRISPMGSSQGVGPIPASPRTPTSPSYPPRPQLRQQYEVIDEEPASTGITASGRKISPPSNGEITKAASSSSSPESTISPSRFPQRRDIRGTIRRAVERLQDEWPQSRSPGPYVPRTQYQARNGSLDASPASEDKNNNPPAY
ncbi:hypothetical protein BGX27_002697 [Mortierella sp. AM989]|nr:hypothetical protein BGX27_002697 [Mortierella sp. AM989]